MSALREAPPSVRSLSQRIDNLARDRGAAVRSIQRLVANTVVCQMLPPGAIKGGTSLVLRLGGPASRFTPDLDAVYAADLTLDAYLERLAIGLEHGWGGFAGRLARREPAVPLGVPPAYVMQPFDVALVYRGAHWLTVRFELAHDEIGGVHAAEAAIAPDTLRVFSHLGLPAPAPVAVLSVEHQIAQKLHACTATGLSPLANDRAHDLVDIQLLVQSTTVDMAALDAAGVRLFAARGQQAWPPTVRALASWGSLYQEAADDLDVLDDVDEAVAWTNALIGRARAAGAACAGMASP